MFSKTSALIGAIAAVGLCFISIPPASAKDTAAKDTIGGLSPCIEGQTAKLQVDGSWACEDDVSAATECGAGEVYLADGAGGGVCLPVAPLVGGSISDDASSCPCDFLEAVSPRHTWFEGRVFCHAQATTQPPVPIPVHGEYALLSIFRDDLLLVTQSELDLSLSCSYFRGGDPVALDVGVDEGAEVSDCFADLQTVAIALGFSCPEPPVFEPQ
jgi:hypothetical protein